ncbi:BCCT family transporter [Iodobacter sp. LRB]|uniref:BCCT family transporter n=1 Tax=unclassified Iodobacter TaxID=235634 RepID=UPI000C0CE004|nr:BCCT family transporter [Iodobacter sp. BJB302]PHV02016.1 transporter [Iodobacter sp. BJB302]
MNTSTRLRLHHTLSMPVFLPSMILIGILLAICTLNPQAAEQIFSQGQAWVTQKFSWFYILSVAIFVITLVAIACSPYGNTRLGPDDAKPEYNFTSWVAMLFAAGMGIGLMYFGVGEPMQHYLSPPLAQGSTMAAAREAMTVTFFHWGFHAWAIYCLVGLVLAYFGFRYNLPLTIRSGLYPILRDKINGPIGHAVDVFALCGTIFGIATTLGYGILQISAGLHSLTGWETSNLHFQYGLIAVVIGLAGWSAASGLDKGVRRLSELNLSLAIILMLFVLFAGPTLFLLGAFGDNIGHYFSSLVELTFRSYTYEPTQKEGWFSGWTLLYWAWWISWSPFVGMFIARISRGRTLREFIIGVMLIPALFNLVWMTIFGNTAIWLDMHTAAGALSQTAGNVDALLFKFFEYLPLVKVTSSITILLIAVFFVTSADSGAFVLNTIATRGAEKSPAWQSLFWAGLLGATAAILLTAGGLKALQAVTLIAALPFTVIMLLLCFSLCKGLAADRQHFSQKFSPSTTFWTGQHWRTRLAQILHEPRLSDVEKFITKSVEPALNEVATELQKQGLSASVLHGEGGAVSLVVPQANLRDFVYGVRPLKQPVATFALRDASLPMSSRPHHYVPITFFEDGRQGYDVQYMIQQELIADVLKQYERYLSLVQNQDTHLLNSAPGHT